MNTEEMDTPVSVPSCLFAWVSIITTSHIWPCNAAPAFIIHLRSHKLCSDKKKKQPCLGCAQHCPGVLSLQVSRKRIIMSFRECSQLWIGIFYQGISQFCLALYPRNLPGINILRTSIWQTQWDSGLCVCCRVVVSSCHLVGGVAHEAKTAALGRAEQPHEPQGPAAIWTFNACASPHWLEHCKSLMSLGLLVV